MSDIFKKGVQKDLTNLGVKNPELQLNADIISSSNTNTNISTPQVSTPATTPKPNTPTIPVKKITQSEINKGFSSQDDFEKAFGATPDKTLSREAIKNAPSKNPKISAPTETQKKSSAAILTDVNEGFNKSKILPTAPIASTLSTPVMKPGEMFYLDPEDEYSARKTISKSIEGGLKTGVNPLTKAKLTPDQTKSLQDIKSNLEKQTLLENIEQGNIATDDINSWKRTNRQSPFQQVLKPQEIINTSKQSFVQTKDLTPKIFSKKKIEDDLQKAYLIDQKNQNEYAFQKSVFGEDYANQQRDAKLKTPVFTKAGTTTGEEIIKEAKANVVDLESQIKDLNTQYAKNKNRVFAEQAVINKNKGLNAPSAGSGYYAVDQELIKYGIESKKLQAQIEQNKSIIENPSGKSNAEINAAKGLESYLVTQIDLLKTPKEKMQDQLNKIAAANQTKLPVFTTIPGNSRLSFYDPTSKKTSIIPSNNVKDVFKFLYNKSYNEITLSTDPKNLKTYAEIAAYVEKFPGSKFAKDVLRLGEEKGKTLGFQGDWLPDLIKKNKAYDNDGNLNSRLGFSDDPVAVYAASLNSNDRSNPLLEGKVTQSFISNWAKDFFVNSSLNSDKQFILADRMDKQDQLDKYTNIEKPVLLDRLNQAKTNGDLEEIKNIEHLIQVKDNQYTQRLSKFQQDDERNNVLLKSADARMATKGELSDEFENLKRNGNRWASSADGTRQFLEFMAPTMIMELATAGLATPEIIAASSAGAFAKTAGTLAYRAIKVAAPLYSRLNESLMEVSGARTDFYDKKLATLLEEKNIELPLTATIVDKENALVKSGVSNIQLANLRQQSRVGTDALFWKNMALVIPDLVELDFLSSTLLGAEKKAGVAALKSSTRERFLNLTAKGVGIRIPLKQTGKLIGEGYLKSYLPEKFEEGIQYAFQQTYNKQAGGFTEPSFLNATGTFIKDAFDAATSIGFIPGMKSSLGGKYANDEEFQLSADLGGLLGGASAGIGIVNSVRKAGVAFNQAHNALDKLGFYDPNFIADKISSYSLKELLKKDKIEYITKLIQDQKSLLEQKGDLNKIYKYSKDELRALQDDPELKNIKELQAQLGEAATSELNNTVDFLEREHFRNKLYDNQTTPSQQYDRFVKQLNRAQEIYNAANEQLNSVKSDKFFSTVNKDVRKYAETLSTKEKSKFLKSFGGKTRVVERLQQSIAEHAMAVARAEQDIDHVDNMLKKVISDEEQNAYFKIPKLRELFYDELVLSDLEEGITQFEMMSSLDPNVSPDLKKRLEFVKKQNRAKRLDINRRFKEIQNSLTEPLESSNQPSLKEQQDYLNQFVVKGTGFTRFNRELIRETPELVNPTTLELIKEKSRRSTTHDFAKEQLTNLSKIKTASQLAAWHNTNLTNVEKQLIKDRATRLKELENKANNTPQDFTENEEVERNDLKDALDIPQDATQEEVQNSISTSVSETDNSNITPTVVDDITIQLDDNFDFSIMPANPMAKVQLQNYPLALNVRGIKGRIQKNEIFTITEINNDQGYFKVTTFDGKTTVIIPIKNGPLDGTKEVGIPTPPTAQDKLDNSVTVTVDTPSISIADQMDPLPTESIIPQEVKDIQSKKVEEVKNALLNLNNKNFVVNPDNENTYLETDANGNIIKDANGEPIVYDRVSTLKGPGKDIKGDAADRGTIIDTLLRGFINNEITSIKELISEYNKHPKKNSVRPFTPKFLGEMFEVFKSIKESTDAVGMQLISTIPTLWGKIGGSNFAGTIDLMGIAKDGSVYIIDLKTASRNRRDVNDEYYQSYKTGDSIQQSAYGELLRQQTGITVKGLTIFPLQTFISNGAYNTIIPNLSEGGKFTMPVEINKAIFPEATGSIVEPEVAPQQTTQPTTTTSNINKERVEYGLEPLKPTYRGASIEEWNNVKNGGKFKSKEGFGENKNNVTWVSDKKEYSEEYAKANNGVLIEFKPESIDKTSIESGQQNDNTGIRLGRDLDLNDVQKVTDANGNILYDAEINDIERRRQEELEKRVVYDRIPTVEDGEFKIIGDPNNQIFRINENTGRPQVLDETNGLWSNTAESPNMFMETTKRSGFQKSKDKINAKYDAELADLKGKQQDSAKEEVPTITQPTKEIVEYNGIDYEVTHENGKVQKITKVNPDGGKKLLIADKTLIKAITESYEEEFKNQIKEEYEQSLKSTELENTIEDLLTIDLKYRGKLIYSSSGSGKSTLVKKAEGLVDADDLLNEAILEVEPSGQVSVKEVYSLPIWNTVRKVFFDKIKKALSENKTVLSANKAVRFAKPSELKIDYVFLHKSPSEFVERTKDRDSKINEFVANKLYLEEQQLFPQANGYYTPGITITDFLKDGNNIPDSNRDSLPNIPEQPITPTRTTNKVDGRLSLSYNFFTKAGVRTNEASTIVDNKKSRMNTFVYSSPEDQQKNYSIIATPINNTLLTEFNNMGMDLSKGIIPIQVLLDPRFNQNGFSSEQIAALQNGQPILLAVNNVISKVFNIADENGSFMEIGSPYRLVLVKPTKTTQEMSGINGDTQVFLNSGSLTAEIFNPNKYSIDFIGNLIKFNNSSKQASQSEIEAFVERFNESLKIYNVLNNLPTNTPLPLSQLEGIVSVKTSIGELNFTNNVYNIGELPVKMLYPFGKESGYVVVDVTKNGIRTIYADKNKLSESNNQKVLKLDLGNSAGLKLVVAHPTIPNRLLYINVEMPFNTVPVEEQGYEILNIISNKIQSIIEEGLDLNRDVKSYNDKMSIFGKYGSIQIQSTKLKNTFFNLKVSFKDNDPMFYLEVKNTSIGSGIIKIQDLIEATPKSLNDFIEVIHSKLTNPKLKELFKNDSGNDFEATLADMSINAIMNNGQTKLSTVQPFTNPGVTINLVNDLESNIAAISNNIDQNTVSSLEDNIKDDQSEVNYGEMFDDVYDMSAIAINQMLKQTGRTKQSLRDFIIQEKIMVITPDQISDILTKMC